jgi:hypothetical protein
MLAGLVDNEGIDNIRLKQEIWPLAYCFRVSGFWDLGMLLVTLGIMEAMWHGLYGSKYLRVSIGATSC